MFDCSASSHSVNVFSPGAWKRLEIFASDLMEFNEKTMLFLAIATRCLIDVGVLNKDEPFDLFMGKLLFAKERYFLRLSFPWDDRSFMRQSYSFFKL